MRKKIFWAIVFCCCFALDGNAEDISLKISAEPHWKSWGDYILGQDLKQGLEAEGHKVVPAYIGDFYPEGSEATEVDIYMHGFAPFNPKKSLNKTNVMYLYYPLVTANTEKYKNLTDVKEPDWYSLQTELWNFDLIAVSSPTYLKEIEKLGIKTIFAPQFTNPEKFFYEYDRNKAYDILFVGRPGYERISAKWAIELGFDVALFGQGWQDKAPKEFFKGGYIDNGELHKYYASAKIVLNDTRADMKKAGFISNRVFDVTASGGFLISDYMKEIEDFYGDSVPMFKNKEELKELLDYYLTHPEEREKKAKAAQKITLANFTNTVVAKKILVAAQAAKGQKEGIANENGLDFGKLAVKSPWPDNAYAIGDYWLGLDFLQGLRDAGFEVKNYYYDYNGGGFKPDNFYHEAGNLLYLQFKNNQTELEDEQKAKVMYLYFPTYVPERGKFKNIKTDFIYNTDVYLDNELEFFDAIATPAKKVYEELRDKGYKAFFVPQFTNPDKFKPEPHDDLQTDLLFVGSTWYERISAKYAAELQYNLSVYGLNWDNKIDKKYIKGSFIDNRELHKYYSSAKIVLSDQAKDLSEMGLVINRLYDATAAGAFVISEYSPYIEEIFGGSVPLFKSKEEFKTLVDFYLAHPEERAKKAEKAKEITLKKYTNRVVGEKLKNIFSKLRREKP